MSPTVLFVEFFDQGSALFAIRELKKLVQLRFYSIGTLL